MKFPLFIRPLTENERGQIQAGLRAKDAFVLRRCQVLLASERGERATTIAGQLGCHRQTVLNIIHGFNAQGLAVLQEGSSRPHRLRPTFPDEALEALQDCKSHNSAGDFCTIERVMRETLKRRDRRLLADLKPSIPEMCSTLGISRSTLSRDVREAKKASDRPAELDRNRPHHLGIYIQVHMHMRRPEDSELHQRRCRPDLARVLGKDWCKKPRGFPPAFTKTVHNHPLLERFFRLSMG